MEKKNLGFDLAEIFGTFGLTDGETPQYLNEWVNATYSLDEFEQHIIDDLHRDISVSGDHMNEEELKAKLVSFLFYVAKVQVAKRVMVFYERPISGVVQDMPLSVVCDCMVAKPVLSNPKRPYFFLQEFKKKKGEKKDPEAQMLIAMLIAQAQNNDTQPMYGGYLVGTSWKFTTLVGKDYCVSRIYEATNKQDLLQIVYILRRLRELIMERG